MTWTDGQARAALDRKDTEINRLKDELANERRMMKNHEALHTKTCIKVDDLLKELDRLKATNAELLEALKGAIPLLEHDQRKFSFEVLPLTRARAAIAKAKPS